MDGKLVVRGGVISNLTLEQGKPHLRFLVMLFHRDSEDEGKPSPTMQVSLTNSTQPSLNSAPDPLFFGDALVDSYLISEFRLPDGFASEENAYYFRPLDLTTLPGGRSALVCRVMGSTRAVTLPLTIAWV
ncbi:hypothetical protein ACFO5K_02700 [Nocardia halotolerans]|uniref:Ig-like domain-containing protein n=1 Tax=Nocardia halotolerans TaxID=1755878 RepID=A0ABV8VD46_9NOCA